MSPSNIFYAFQEMIVHVASGTIAPAALREEIASALIEQIPSAGDEADFLRQTLKVAESATTSSDVMQYIASLDEERSPSDEDLAQGGAPSSRHGRDVALHVARAHRLGEEGHFRAALGETKKALRINPRAVKALCLKASVLALLGLVDMARQDLLKARKIDPLDPNTYMLNACITMDYDKDAIKAVAEFEAGFERGYPRIPPMVTWCEALLSIARDEEVMKLLK